MRVSVVVPSYNHARWVPRCLGAIDRQDHDDLEVIVVDDGSTDGSQELIAARRWGSTRRVRTVSAAHRGAHAAINHGLTLATGDYMAICNMDDCFAPGRISTLARRLENSASRFAFTGVRFVDDHEVDVTETDAFARDHHRRQQEIDSYPSIGFAILRSNVAISTGNFFFARSLLDEIGFFRPYRYVHDWDFLLRAVLFTEPVYVPELLYLYRLHQGNTFRSLGSLDAEECPEVLRRFLRAAITGGYPNPLAPSPRNWPDYFERFLDEHDWLMQYMTDWDGLGDVVYPHVER
jgi:glycosyltransferase involved in cell wall biosynthesis